MALAERSDLFESVFAEVLLPYGGLYPLALRRSTHLVRVKAVTDGFFPSLGVRAESGRLLEKQDEPTVAVANFSFWKGALGSDPNSFGREIRLNGHPFTIVGLLNQSFSGLDLDAPPDIYVPASAYPILAERQLAPDSLAFVYGRLKPGIPVNEAADISERITREVALSILASSGGSDAADRRQLIENYKIGLRPMEHGTSQLREQFRRGLKVLMGSAMFLLLMVWANAAAFVVARAEGRRRETAIRLALGASTQQLAAAQFAGMLPLALTGGGAGIVMALMGGPLLLYLLPVMREGIAYLPVNPKPWLGLDIRIAGFAVIVTIGITLALTAAAALVSTRLSVSSELKLQPFTAPGRRLSIRGILTCIQIAITMLLLSGAALLFRTYRALERTDPGFDRAHVVLFTVAPKVAGFQSVQMKNVYAQIQAAVEHLPGIRAAAWSELGLMRGTGMKATVSRAGYASPHAFMNTSLDAVSPEYFDVMGMHLLSGRDLRENDAANPDRKRVVINQAFERMLFPAGDPLGKTFVIGNSGTGTPVFEVAGVVSDARFRSLREERPPTFYGLPSWTMTDSGIMILHLSTFGDPREVIDEVRAAIGRTNPDVPITEISTLEQEVQNSLWQERLILRLVEFFALAALLLSGIGLYAGISQAAQRRRREFGIRRAIGAKAWHIATALSRGEAVPVTAGIAMGLSGAWAIASVAGSFLYGVTGLDPTSYVAAAGFVFMAAAIALCAPLMRAIRVDPAVALREE